MPRSIVAPSPRRRTNGLAVLFLSMASVLSPMACAPPEGTPVSGGGSADTGGLGPGRRAQSLALSPEEELQLGRKAYREILAKSQPLPQNSEPVRRVRRVGGRIARAAEIEPLDREINLHFDPNYVEWEFNVLEDKQVNAFCLPGGKVVVYTGLLNLVQDDDDYLATVISHEIAHALAHHASERLATQNLLGQAHLASDSSLNRLDNADKARIVQVLAGLGSSLYGLSAERKQESEADHIGLFLMTFAGYDPEKAVNFWQRMMQESQGRGAPFEILSDHPSDARRINQIQAWAPQAEGAKKAFDEGRIAPAGR